MARSFRAEARAPQSRQPRTILDVRLPARDLLHVRCIHEQAGDALRKDVVDRFPLDTGRRRAQQRRVSMTPRVREKLTWELSGPVTPRSRAASSIYRSIRAPSAGPPTPHAWAPLGWDGSAHQRLSWAVHDRGCIRRPSVYKAGGAGGSYPRSLERCQHLIRYGRRSNRSTIRSRGMIRTRTLYWAGKRSR